jgi:hypothetical protein
MAVIIPGARRIPLSTGSVIMRQFLAFAVLVISSSGAFAITCHGNYQVVNGDEISTPFCRDNALAAVARQYGHNVSDAEMRNNPSKKEEICRALRDDTRVYTACAEVIPYGGGS